MGALGGFEWLIIILVLVFLFGAKKIPEMARGIGRGIVEVRKASSHDDENDSGNHRAAAPEQPQPSGERTVSKSEEESSSRSDPEARPWARMWAPESGV